MSYSSDDAAGLPIRRRISDVGRGLAEALGSLVDSLAGAPPGAQWIAETLQINKVASHRLVAALRGKDPLATVHLIPGPDPLRRLVKVACEKGAPTDIARQADQAIGAFEQLIANEAGDRGSLDAIIGDMLPEVRARHEATAKQTIYRGMRQVCGVSAEVKFEAFLSHPTADPARLDHVSVHGYLRVCRIRPSAQLKVASLQSTPSPGQPALCTLDGEAIGDGHGFSLEQFCTSPPARLHAHRAGQDVDYTIGWDDTVGLTSARDVVLAEVRRSAGWCYRRPDVPRKKTGDVVEIDVPARTLICDLLLHEEIYPNQAPSVRVLRLGVRGFTDVDEDVSNGDVLDLIETIQPLGTGIDHFGCDRIPEYRELLHHTCGKLGWDPKRFRGYRCRIDYPIVGTQVQFAFELPIGPSASAPNYGGAASNSGA